MTGEGRSVTALHRHNKRNSPMNIPARFELHYVQNGVKQSVTILTDTLFKKPAPVLSLRAQPSPALKKSGKR